MKKCRLAIMGVWSASLFGLLAVFQTAVAYAGPWFDETKRVVLPGHAATTILKRYIPDGDWNTAEWPINSKNLDILEVALASPLASADFANFKSQAFYRQYMPARWKGLHLIVVNGFHATDSDMYPEEKRIGADEWKRDLLTVFGGGCGFWSAIYLVEENRLMSLQPDSDHAAVACNAPK